MDIIPLRAGCGAEIHGVDLNALSDLEAQAIADAHADYGVVFLRGQQLTPAAQLRAAERFGAIDVNRFFTPIEEEPRVALVLKEAAHETNVGGGWHTDHSYDDEPAMGSMLYAVEVPGRGGDTLFANMYAAYQSLSAGLRETLLGLRAVHSSRHVFGPRGYHEQNQDDRYRNAALATQDAIHPVVVRHPRSGRAALYVNPAFTVRFHGWTELESRPLLEYLYRAGSRLEHTCRFRWEPGSVAFWDNRATWHYALNDYPGECRRMHRVTVEGEALAAYAAEPARAA